MEKNILDAAIAANQAMNPIALDNASDTILDTASANVTEEQAEQIQNLKEAVYNPDSITLNSEALKQWKPRKPIQQVRDYQKIGRNEPCPCGSGKKYKHCCLNSGKYEGLHNAQRNIA